MHIKQSIKRFKWLFLVLAVLALLAPFTMWAMSEYTKTGRCYKTNSVLSPQELRVRVIRSLLMAEINMVKQYNRHTSNMRSFLIPRSMTSNDLIDSVLSKSIVNLPQEAVYQIITKQDIVNLDTKFLQGKFSVVSIERNNEEMHILPINSLKSIEKNTIQQYLYGRDRESNLDYFDRLHGYGNYYFQISSFNFINLRCCEDREKLNQKNGYSQEWYTRNIIDSIKQGMYSMPSYIIVSNCGDVLSRKDNDGYTYHRF